MQSHELYPFPGCSNKAAKSENRESRTRSTRGGALLTALILMTAVSIVIAHVMRTATVEARLTSRSYLKLQSDNSAELLLDYALGDLARRMDEEVSFAKDEFSPSKNSLEIRTEVNSDFKKLGVDTDSLVLTAGPISTISRLQIDPTDPANRFDPLKGKVVYVRYLNFYARATTVHPTMGNTTSYGRMIVQLRDAPLTAHAIFYNMDLEVMPQPDMTIDGPVHANGNVWLITYGGTLSFEGIVTCSGDLRIGRMENGSQTSWSGSKGNGLKVQFRNVEDEWQTLRRQGGGNPHNVSGYYTSISDNFDPYSYDSWREYATNEFGGNIQTKTHGIPALVPAGISKYVPDTVGTSKLENHGYSLIEPNLPLSSLYHKGVAEDQKFARKAGLIIRVHRDLNNDGIDDDRLTALPARSVRLRRRENPNDGWTAPARAFYGYWKEKADLGEPYAPGTGPAHPTAFETNFHLSFDMIRRKSNYSPNSDPVLKTATKTVTNDDGESVTITISEVTEDPVYLNEAFQEDKDQDGDLVAGGLGDELRAQFDEAFAAHPLDYTVNGGNYTINSGMQDKRIYSTSKPQSLLNLIEINMAAFANIVENPDSPLFSNYKPEDRFNGIVYVEFPIDPTAIPRPTDKVLRSVENIALILTEGGGSNPEIGRVPDPLYNHKAGRDEGFTLATNQAVYIRGHFNADGDLNTPNVGSMYDSDDPLNPDPPVMIAGDAITILSGMWKMEDSSKSRPWAEHTEVNAAVVAGIRPTNKAGTSYWSYAVNNMMRFLENWRNRTMRYKGSIVVPFESEIQNERPPGGHFNPPKRDYGFNRRFYDGVYPPGTPTFQTYRKIDFRYITEDEFNEEMGNLPWSVSLPSTPK